MSFLSQLTVVERRTFYASLGGWSLDALDYMVYTFVIATLISLWGISKQEAGALATVTLLFSAVGGWVAGILADRFGRVRILQLTVVWFAVSTLLISFAQNFGQMFALRALQGLGFGGEWAVGAVLMGEVVQARHRGRLVGYVQSGWAIGWGTAAILYTVVFSLLPEALAWRALFALSAVPAVLVIFVRRYVPESPVFARRAELPAATASFWSIFKPPFLRVTAPAALLCVGMQGGNYAVTTWLPTYLKMERGLSVIGTGSYLFVIVAGSFFGFVSGAWLSDRIGRRLSIIAFMMLAFASLYFYVSIPVTNGVMLLLGFPLGFCTVGCFGGIGAYLTELFPSSHRANGQGFAYNFGRGLGALFPALVGMLSTEMGLGSAILLFAAGAYVIAALVIFLLPETRSFDLDAVDADWLTKQGIVAAGRPTDDGRLGVGRGRS